MVSQSTTDHYHHHHNNIKNGSIPTRNGKLQVLSSNKLKCPSTSCWDNCMPVSSRILPWSSLIVFAAACVCFSQSVRGEFVFDDTEAVTNNFDVRPDTPLSNVFKNDFWGTKLTHNASHKSYRPLTVLTFRINYRLFGLDPTSFHLVNVILHGVVSVLILRVSSLIFCGVLGDDGAPKAAFTCALLFAVHPIHTESVSAVVGRADLLCAIFFLLSFLCYASSFRSYLPQDVPCVVPHASSYCLVLSLLLAGTSMLCKEQGITVIGICCVYDMVIVCKFDLLHVLCHTRVKSDSPLHLSGHAVPANKKWSLFTLRQLILALGSFVLLALRWYVMGSTPPVFQQVDNPASFEENILIRVMNYNYVYAVNSWLMLHPYWLCFDWSMGCIPLIRSLFDGRLLAVAMFWIAFGVLVYYSVLHPNKKTRRLLCIALAFILVPFLPASNLFFRVGFVVAERALYLPSMGFCILIVLGIRQLTVASQQSYHIVVQGSFLLLIVAFIVRCMQRTSDWRTEETLFRSGLKVCPLNAKVHYNIAKNAADHGDSESAIDGYKEAIRLNPTYDQAMNNLANILKDKGELVEAENLLVSAIKIRPDFAAAWMNLGIVQSSLKKMQEAERSYLMAIRCRRRYPDCYYNLGNLYLEQKQYDGAYRAWRNATALQPTHLVAWNNMVIMLDSIGELQKAEAVAREALKYLPSEASLHFNLANTLGKAGRYEESEKHFLKAIRMNGNNPTYHTNLGVLYHRWKKYNLAEAAYKEALKLNGDMKSAQENLQLLYKAAGRV